MKASWGVIGNGSTMDILVVTGNGTVQPHYLHPSHLVSGQSLAAISTIFDSFYYFPVFVRDFSMSG
jgi:hypothetical protein